MKQFKTLITKEWHSHKHSFLIPSYVVAAFFILLGIASIWGSIRFGLPEFDFENDIVHDPKDVIWTLHYAMSVVIAWFAILTSITINDSMLNGDYQKKCEIMHNSQPVSMVKILAAKLSFSIPMMLVQYLVLACISSLIVSAVLAFFGFNGWFLGLHAVISPFLMILVSMLALTSIFWMFSCFFRKQAALKFWLVMIVIDLLRLMITRIWPISHMFSPYKYYLKLLLMPFSMIKIKSTGFNFGWDSMDIGSNLLSLFISILMFIAGYYLYKQRELS
ncbi:MAG: hypothetical protein PHU99_00860 [Candidatus Cloacimonetes bacterium]|jgi:hypothetical protein|nr:hypothetical protein [Candidatus Cloacimonadota bacterium]MDY0336993.1 hypothetical protein [Candidatus Cloacimonadaceae bacterium]MDD2683409.1 hypothetical protein [Candidatus Cloacimonadota bacterium]MDD3096256.1 hypothetical protein [Candidatus Cloacimonadota bacterium]MDD3578264.1 hypothetical protein [Candidatus Cloacimonadota bacterium]